MTSQDNREVVVPVNSSVATKITRVNPPKFHGSKVEEEPHEFIDEAYKVFMIMRVKYLEKKNWLVINLRVLLKCISTNLSKRGWLMQVIWIEKFKAAFLDRFFPFEMK